MTGDFGRRNNLGVPHLLVYGTADDLQHAIAPSLEDAMVYAEYLANAKNDQSFRVFELREVDMAVKRYYQVQLLDGAGQAGGESVTAPPVVAELKVVPDADADVAVRIVDRDETADVSDQEPAEGPVEGPAPDAMVDDTDTDDASVAVLADGTDDEVDEVDADDGQVDDEDGPQAEVVRISA